MEDVLEYPQFQFYKEFNTIQKFQQHFNEKKKQHGSILRTDIKYEKVIEPIKSHKPIKDSTETKPSRTSADRISSIFQLPYEINLKLIPLTF